MKFVLDSSFIISLNIGGILKDLFTWAKTQQYLLCTTDLVAEELTEPPASLLQDWGLTTYSLSSDDLLQANHIAAQNLRVSLQDVSVIVLAQNIQACVLTDDKPMRDLAQQKGITVYGSLGVLDQLVKYGQISEPQACEAIQKMLQGGRRLPKEVVRQLRRQFNC